NNTKTQYFDKFETEKHQYYINTTSKKEKHHQRDIEYHDHLHQRRHYQHP
ncbi:hypothetical protein LINPERHAP1_LOCUS30199, partial [Linum perenne]